MNAGPENKQPSESDADMTTPEVEDIDTAAGDDGSADGDDGSADGDPITDVTHAAADTAADPTRDAAAEDGRRRGIGRIVAGVAVAVIIALAAASTYLGLTHRANVQLRDEHPVIVNAAREGATAVLSYRAVSVEADVAAAQERLTGSFADEYRALVQNEVLPAAKERRLTSTAQVSGASLIQADSEHAQTLVFVTQSVAAEGAAAEPTTTTAAFRVGLTKHDGKWLIDSFEPI